MRDYQDADTILTPSAAGFPFKEAVSDQLMVSYNGNIKSRDNEDAKVLYSLNTRVLFTI